jgi:hypothetical protein
MKWSKTPDGRLICKQYDAVILGPLEDGGFRVWCGSKFVICDSIKDAKDWVKSAIQFKR